MIRNETRESAHLRSRIKDLSVVPNVVSYTGLFAAITPIAKLKHNSEGLYDPILVRDTESLIANFGDPRIDPKKYIDLYSIMQVVGNGTSCYIAKVNSGDSGVYKFPLLADKTHSSNDFISELPTKDFQQKDPYHYSIENLENKYVITSLKGYTDGESRSVILYSKPSDLDPSLTTNGEVDFTGDYTWSCNQQADGNFTLEITLTENPDDRIKTLVASCSIDPSWGSEAISVLANTDDDRNVVYNYDAASKKFSFTLTSEGKLENEYILLSSAIDNLKSDLEVDDTEPDIDYLYSDGKLVIIVTFNDINDNTALETSLDDILKPDDNLKSFTIGSKTRESHSLIAYSSMSEDLKFKVYVSQTKPYSLNVYYLNVEVKSADEVNTLGKARVKLENTTTNQGLVNNLNSALGAIIRFELIDPSTESASPKKDRGANSIVKALLDTYCQATLTEAVDLEDPIVVSESNFHVSMNDYIAAIEQYKAKKYTGCLMADLVAPVSRNMSDDDKKDFDADDVNTFMPSQDERRALHYNLKQIAYERKDCTVVLSTPYCESKDNITALTIDDACDWVTSQNKYADLWEYGVTNTVDYSAQSFYLEIYFSWLNQTCTKIESGLAKSVKVLTAPSNLVINNILTSYRERGVNHPVAGDQYGTLPETCAVTVNPKTKAERDQLVQCRINPIYDTGTRGIQIYGNETLNAGYTDLNAAHIARTLVNIRSQVDEYTETLKFLINSQILWDQWKNYVSMYILEPFKAANALAEYDVKMGEDTTSRAEIANRSINGVISLRFYQAAEIFDLTFVVYSTATTLEEEGVI